jgi:prolyl-tRNA editing enzyme YbaK/EbsC (Cys-tRNA(Pro) deacylase)
MKKAGLVALLAVLVEHFQQGVFGFLPTDHPALPRRIGTRFAFVTNENAHGRGGSKLSETQDAINIDKEDDSSFCTPSAADKTTSPLAALDHFLSVRADYSWKRPGASIGIISRGSSKIPNHQEIDIEVYSSAEDDCIVSIFCKGRGVSLSKLTAAIGGSSSIRLVETDELVSYCGFMAGSIPPFGHYSPKNVSLVVDQDLLLLCQSEDRLLLGNGGYAYWQCLVHPDTMVSFPNVQVADIVLTDENSEGVDKEAANVQSITTLEGTAENNLLSSPRPFLEADLPPMSIARLIVQQRDLSNPMTPSLVAIKGRIGRVDRKGKRNADCELLPLAVCGTPTSTSSEDPSTLPWKHQNGKTMGIRLNAGKALIQKLGTTQGEAAIDRLQEGVVIQVEARTNVGNRDALANWVKDGTMDLMVTDYQIFTSDGTVDETASLSASSNPHKNQPKSHVAVPILPVLTLDDIFNVSVSVEVVDNMQSLERFARDFETLGFYLDEAGASMVGVDCEWQPNQLAAPGDSRPVVLLQLSFHALGKVYLFDLQTVFRPMLNQEEPMNELEKRASEVLSKLWSSERILKVGYQLSSDLRRVAASYPHASCFQQVNSVLEVDKLCKKVLHIAKQKKSRSITMSLARMASHYMGKTVDKTCQISDWKARPLTSSQKAYAALDAAVAPALAEKAYSSIDASINPLIPRIERWEGDEGLSKAIDCLRFSFVEIEDAKAAKKLQAKQIVGDYWIAMQTWTVEQDAPDPIA